MISQELLPKDSVHFYEIEGDEDNLIISSEVHVTRDMDVLLQEHTTKEQAKGGNLKLLTSENCMLYSEEEQFTRKH
jgi:hypothetical protein